MMRKHIKSTRQVKQSTKRTCGEVASVSWPNHLRRKDEVSNYGSMNVSINTLRVISSKETRLHRPRRSANPHLPTKQKPKTEMWSSFSAQPYPEHRHDCFLWDPSNIVHNSSLVGNWHSNGLETGQRAWRWTVNLNMRQRRNSRFSHDSLNA